MILEGAIGIAGGILGAIASAVTVAKAVRAPVRELEQKVATLEAERLGERLDCLRADIEAHRTRLEKHLEADQSQRIVTLLETMQGSIRQMGAKIDRLCEENAKNAARLDGVEHIVSKG